MSSKRDLAQCSRMSEQRRYAQGLKRTKQGWVPRQVDEMCRYVKEARHE